MLLRQNEKGAAYKAFILSVVLSQPYLLAGLIDTPYQAVLSTLLIALPVIGFILFLIPLESKKAPGNDIP